MPSQRTLSCRILKCASADLLASHNTACCCLLSFLLSHALGDILSTQISIVPPKIKSPTYFLTKNLSSLSFCSPGVSILLNAFLTPSWTARKICSEKNIVNSRPQALIFHGVPSGPRPSPLKRYTRAADVRLPSHARNPSASSQGPMESARQGTGRWVSKAILRASPRSSIQLFIKKETGTRGQITENRDRYPGIINTRSKFE